MEEWLPRPPESTINYVASVVRDIGITHALATYSEKCETMEPRKAYRILLEAIGSMYYSNPDPRILNIARAFYDLEMGVPLQLGVPRLIPMERGLPPKEHETRLALLDKGRVIFKQVLLDAFVRSVTFADRNVIIRFARLVYECIHGYQAPYRLDPRQATLDAMGKSDHFAELMDEVISASTEACP